MVRVGQDGRSVGRVGSVVIHWLPAMSAYIHHPLYGMPLSLELLSEPATPPPNHAGGGHTNIRDDCADALCGCGFRQVSQVANDLRIEPTAGTPLATHVSTDGRDVRLNLMDQDKFGFAVEWKWHGNDQTITHVKLTGNDVNLILGHSWKTF